MKRFAFLFGLFLCLVLLFTACQGEETTAPEKESSTPATTTAPITTAPTTTTSPETTEEAIPLTATAEVIKCKALTLENASHSVDIFSSSSACYAYWNQHFQSLNLDLETKYDTSFFEKNNLAILYVETGSGTDRLYFSSASFDSEIQKIDFEIGTHTKEIGTTDMGYWLILVSFPKQEDYPESISGTLTRLPYEILDSEDYNEKYPFN